LTKLCQSVLEVRFFDTQCSQGRHAAIRTRSSAYITQNILASYHAIYTECHQHKQNGQQHITLSKSTVNVWKVRQIPFQCKIVCCTS